MRIRSEVEADRTGVLNVNMAAFETSVEADLIEALRSKGLPLISLVADVGGEIVGHILFSPVTLTAHPQLNIMGLGPMAVAPEHQRQGVGSALVRAGLDQCRRRGCVAVVVLGHPQYYPRFGFVPAARCAIRSEYEVPEDVFMLIELEPGVLQDAAGQVRYDEAFRSV